MSPGQRQEPILDHKSPRAAPAAPWPTVNADLHLHLLSAPERIDVNRDLNGHGVIRRWRGFKACLWG